MSSASDRRIIPAAYIPLTKGLCAIVDADDYDTLMRWNWYSWCGKAATYAIRNAPLTDGKRGTLHMHRVIMDAPDNMRVDHINHNGLDNRRANLRLCTNAENSRNTTSAKGSLSKYLGVSWDSGSGKWRAHIRIKGGRLALGRFFDEAEAARAYDAAARLHHGVFANPNFPLERGA